jgi:hypothetical protein
MCAVSFIGDHYSDKWQPLVNPPQPSTTTVSFFPVVTREEFEALRRDVLEMKALLKRAKKYDEDNGEPNCEMADKIAVLRKVAELVGVDLDDVFHG